MFENEVVIVKELLDNEGIGPVLREARLMTELDGAGGAPRLRAVCVAPPAMIQEYVGQIYDDFLKDCSVEDLINSFISVCKCLKEIHARDIVHNDLKTNNITYTGSVSEPVFHLIDFGWACHSGQVAAEQVFPERESDNSEDEGDLGDGEKGSDAEGNEEEGTIIQGDSYNINQDEDEDSSEESEDSEEDEDSDRDERKPWMAPENYHEEPVYASGDVYSVGFVIEYVLCESK